MQRILPPFAVLACLGGLYLGLPSALVALGLNPTVEWAVWGSQALASLVWLVAAKCLNRTLHVVLWEGWCERRSGMRIPKLLTDLVGVLIWVASIIAALAFVYGVQVSGLVAASGVTIAIIGFALRNMIADVFTGIALGIEKPLATADWIELEDGDVGRVTEINWRATRLVTKEEVTKVVPNSYLATHPFINYHTPDDFFRDKFQIILGYEVTTHQAERILLSAVSQIDESTRIPRQPEVRIIDYLEHGLRWELRYWVPDYPSMSALRYRVQRNVLRNLHYAGISVPKEKLEYIDLNHPDSQTDPLSEDVAFLRGIELFDSLETAELERLSQKMERRLALAGEPVVEQGDDTSASLFIVKEGFLDVSITDEGGQSIKVAWLAPDMFFGEMSLLTGAARSATIIPSVDAVLFEILSRDIAPLLEAEPEIAQRLSKIVAGRQMRNDLSLAKASMEEVEAHEKRLSARLLSGIVTFFGLNPAKKSA